MTIRLTRTVEFTASHRLFDPRESEAANRARFGATTEPHPHRYRCAITVEGPVDPQNPMVVDLTVLDRIAREEVTERFDGKEIHRVPPFEVVLPTCEGLAREIFERVSRRLPAPVTLARVSIAEDEFLSAECLAR